MPTMTNPERGWTRSRSLPEITAGFLDAHLGQWPELLDRRWEILEGGLRSLNLRSGNLVARIALAPDQNLRKEAALLRLVGAAVRVPEVIEAGDQALLLEYIEVCELPATGEAGFSVGSSAAGIHRHRFTEAGFLNEELKIATPFDSAIAALENWADQIMPGTAEPMDTAIRHAQLLWEENAERLGAASSSPVLVHSDFKPANIKWSPTEHRAVIFDWEFAWAGPNLFDLGQMFRWNPPNFFVRGVERGYRASGGMLHDRWLQDAELFDLLNLVDFLNRQPADPTRNRQVRNRIGETLKRHRKM